MLNGGSSLNGSSGYSSGARASITVDRTEPWLARAIAGLVSRWPWHGGL